MTVAHWVTGDTRAVTAQLPDQCVDLVLTSSPFLALRSYLPADHPDKASEVGSEPTPAAFIDMLLSLTAEWGRVLAPHGSICVELGDTYSGSTGPSPVVPDGDPRNAQPDAKYGDGRDWDHERGRRASKRDGMEPYPGWPASKSLTLIPELYRIALAYGINPLTGQPSPAGRWRIRNVIRWVRPNPPVGALGDKFRPATTDLVVACKARDRWFDLDAVRTEHATGDHHLKYPDSAYVDSGKGPGDARLGGLRRAPINPAGAPPLDWWNITPGGYPGAHYAVWPPELCVKPIEAMAPRRVCRTCGLPSRRVVGDAEYVKPDGRLHTFNGDGFETHESLANRRIITGHDNGNMTRTAPTTGWTTCACPGTDGLRLDGYHTGTGWRPGIVLDPFAGTGTTLAVATGHGRDGIGIDIDDRNLTLARDRIGMFLHETTALELADVLRGSPVEPLSTGPVAPTTRGNVA